jgi:mono/diheme cytochrome c family protein
MTEPEPPSTSLPRKSARPGWAAAAAAAVVTAMALAVIAGFRQQLGGPVLLPQNASMVSLGQRVYAAQCAACHGEKLEGQPNWRQPGADGLLPAPPHDATGHTWHHPDALLIAITRDGVGKGAGIENHRSAMPAFGGTLTDREIVAVLSYIKAQWPPEVRERHDLINEEYHAHR